MLVATETPLPLGSVSLQSKAINTPLYSPPCIHTRLNISVCKQLIYIQLNRSSYCCLQLSSLTTWIILDFSPCLYGTSPLSSEKPCSHHLPFICQECSCPEDMCSDFKIANPYPLKKQLCAFPFAFSLTDTIISKVTRVNAFGLYLLHWGRLIHV